MSKTETGFRLPHCLAPVVGGGGCLEADLFSVNRSLRLFRQTPECLEFCAKTALGPPRSFPHQSNDSNEVRHHIANGWKIKSLSVPDRPSGLAPKRGGLIWAGGLGCNPQTRHCSISRSRASWEIPPSLNPLNNQGAPAGATHALPCRDIGFEAVSLSFNLGNLVFDEVTDRNDSNQSPLVADG